MAEKSLRIISGVPAIARHVYQDDSPYHQRRVRHLISKGIIRTKKVAGRLETREEWLEAVWAAPDEPASISAQK